MTDLILNLSQSQWIYAIAIALLAGIVKGIVGFAMPMIIISGLSLSLPPELALAGLILPTLATNGYQALRQGARAALGSMIRFRRFLTIGLIFLAISSQMTTLFSATTFLGSLGAIVVLFTLYQLSGRSLPVQGARGITEFALASIAGFIGGMSGVWGPPTVAYLTALNTEKREQMRVQGVIYGLGAVALTIGHIISGIFTLKTAIFSALLLGPAYLGMWIGTQVQDRIDQVAFKRATLIVLLVAGGNLIRRAWFI